MNKFIYTVLFLLLGGTINAQVLRNEGKINVAGGYMVISGSYQNESTGGITLDGKITVSGNWTNNGSGNGIDTPDSNGEVIFNGTTQTIGGSAGLFDFEQLTINSGSTTQVEAGKGVTTYGACTFTSPLVLKTTTTAYRPQMATFINKSTVTGNITAELSYTSTGSSSAGTGHGLFFSSPISNATTTIFDVANKTNSLWYQDEIARQYVQMLTNGVPLTVAKGYILRSKTTSVINFTGTPNTNSSYTISDIPRAIETQAYLVGNPYPSVVTWSSMTKTNLQGTIWYRTCTTAGAMRVDTWNGSVGTNNNGTAAVDGNIPPMQSVWVQVNNVGETGDLIINESGRTHDWGNAPFLRSQSQVDKNILRFYIYTGDQRDEAIIVQTDQAQDGYESMDSRKLFLGNVNLAEVYTITPEKHTLVINSIKPIAQTDTIPLGINVGTAGTFKFVANVTEFSSKNNIFLVDKQQNTKQDLLLNPEYTFTSSAIKDTTGLRFALLVMAKPILVTKSVVSACAPEKADLTQPSVTAGSQEGLVFTYWTDAAATVAYTTYANADPGTYYIKATATNGAYTVSEPITVQINPLPLVAVNAPAAVCYPSTIDITASTITLGSNPDLSFSYWTDKDATQPYVTANAATNGTYYIKGTAQNGCSAVSDAIQVVVNPLPTVITNNPAAVVSPATVDITTPEITLGSSPDLVFTYWLDALATTPFTTPNFAGAGNYYIQGTSNITGCSSIAGPVTVMVISGIQPDLHEELRIFSYENKVYVENCKPRSQITITDMVGHFTYIGISESTRLVIPCNYKTGLYIVKVVSEQNTKSQIIHLQ